MLEQVGRIRNPWVRSMVTAGASFSAVTILSGLVIVLVNPKQESAFRTGLYSALAGAGCGAIAGLVYKPKSSSGKVSPTFASEASASENSWKDWRNFVVVRKVKESEEITSFYLKPQDDGAIPNFQPGQFLTIKLNIPGQEKPIIRTYSLSDYPNPREYYRLSIKREPAPKGLDVMPGIASNFMHDQVQEGSVILAKPPSGKFVLDVQKSLPAVLISNGVGITPMLSMAKACTQLNSNRLIWFIHGARDGRFHAFRDEVKAIARQNPHLQIHFCYSRPRPEDEGHYHSTGYVDIALVQKLVMKEAEYFLCGSPPFMRSLREGLKAWGVSENHVFFESFTKEVPTRSTLPLTMELTNNRKTAEIVFAKSGRTLSWHPGDGTILEFAEANNINPPFSCRQGICLTCMCKIQAGEVAYEEPPVGTPDEGSVLICVSKPETPRVVLDL